MKRLFALLISVLISAAPAHAGEVKVKAVMTTAPDAKPATSFAADTPQMIALFQTTGITKGDKVRGVLVAEDVGNAAPADYHVFEKTLDLNEDTNDGAFTFSKPTKGWPPGKYRVELYVNDKLASKVNFAVGGAKSEKSEEPKEKESKTSAGIPGEEELKSMTDSSILSFGEAIKDKDFSGFYTEIAAIWQTQTSAEKLNETFKDFVDKDIDLPSALKGMEPVFDRPASIGSNGVLVVQGYYPTKPNRVVFQLKYLKEEDEWKLVGINVNLKESGWNSESVVVPLGRTTYPVGEE
jgi:hypothetical protein